MFQRFSFAIIACFAACVPLGVKAVDPDAPQFEGRFHWDFSDKWFGGFSGVEITDQGNSFVAISDWGYLVKGKLIREDGQISAVQIDTADYLTRLGEDRLDAEGLAYVENHDIFVSIEGENAVARIPIQGSVNFLPRATAFLGFDENSGMEALAIDTQGRLYTLPENTERRGADFPVWRFEHGTWKRFGSLPREGSFRPVGADFGPDGKFYLLERQFSGIGFRSRIRRFTLAEDGFTNSESILTTALLKFGNLEGLSVWRDIHGQIRLTLLSDDNYLAILSTEWVEYSLP